MDLCVTSAKRQEIDWRSHPSGNENQKSQLVTWNYLKVSIIEHSPWPSRKNVSVRGSECGRRNENAIEKTNQRLHNRFRSKTFFYFVDAREISRSPDDSLIGWLLGRLLDHKKLQWISKPKVSSRRRSWATDLKNEISWVSITRKPAPKRIINRNQEIKLILLRIFALDSFVCWFCRRLVSRELFPRCQNAEPEKKKKAPRSENAKESQINTRFPRAITSCFDSFKLFDALYIHLMADNKIKINEAIREMRRWTEN